MQKLKKPKRKQQKTEIYIKQNRTTLRKTYLKKKTEIHDIQPSTRPRINISQVPAGRFLFFRFLCFSLSFKFSFCFYMCFFDCKCKSLKRLGEHINKQKETENKTEKLEEKQNKQKYRISSPRPDRE